MVIFVSPLFCCVIDSDKVIHQGGDVPHRPVKASRRNQRVSRKRFALCFHAAQSGIKELLRLVFPPSFALVSSLFQWLVQFSGSNAVISVHFLLDTFTRPSGLTADLFLVLLCSASSIIGDSLCDLTLFPHNENHFEIHLTGSVPFSGLIGATVEQ